MDEIDYEVAVVLLLRLTEQIIVIDDLLQTFDIIKGISHDNADHTDLVDD